MPTARSISFGDKGPCDEDKLLNGPGDVRALGTMHFRMGDYADCLALLAEAEERLERVRSRVSSRAYGDELARIRAAYALVHMDLGEYERAEASAAEAAEIQEGLAKMGERGTRRLDRVLQASINHAHLGNARREKARVLGAGFEGAHEAYADARCMLTDDGFAGGQRSREATRSSSRRHGTGLHPLSPGGSHQIREQVLEPEVLVVVPPQLPKVGRRSPKIAGHHGSPFVVFVRS